MNLKQIKHKITTGLFLEIDKIDNFTCLLCDHPFSNPCLDDCDGPGHTFCYDCLKSATKSNQICPISHKNLKSKNMVKDIITFKEMMGLKMNCPFYVNGCKTLTTLCELPFHFRVCKFSSGFYLSDEVTFKGSGGKPFNFFLDWKTKNMKNIRLKEIIFNFDEDFRIQGRSTPCLRRFQLVWEEKKDDGTTGIITSPNIESKGHLRSIVKHTNYVLKENEKISGFIFYLGKSFYPALGIINPSRGIEHFGFLNERKYAIPIIFPQNAVIVGFSGNSGTVIDSISFYYCIIR